MNESNSFLPLSKFYFFLLFCDSLSSERNLATTSVRIFLFSFYRSSNFVTSFLEDKFFEIRRIRLTKLIREKREAEARIGSMSRKRLV